MTSTRIATGDALRAAAALWRPLVAGAWAPLLGLSALAFVLSPALGLAPVWALVLAPANLLVSVLGYGAMMRLALARGVDGAGADRPGPAGLQWTAIETSLLGAFLLLALFVALCAIGAVFALMLIAIVVAAVTGPVASAPSLAGFVSTPSGFAASAVFAVTFGFLIWACVRLILSTPASADRRQVQVFSTWGLTRGNVLPLFLALLVIAVPAIVLGAAARLAAGQAVALAVWVAYALAVGLLQTPLTAAVTAFAYRRLIAADDAAPGFN